MSITPKIPDRYFSLKEAREILPEVQKITEYYFKRMQEVKKVAIAQKFPKPIVKLMDSILYQWLAELPVGVYGQGDWMCDFDNGDGICFCWQYPEPDILFFHMKNPKNSDRRPISLLE